MKPGKIFNWLKRPLVAGTLVFATLLAINAVVTWQRYLLYKDSRNRELANAAEVAKDKIETTLTSSLSATKTLGYLVTRYGRVVDFDETARKILESNKHIDALELVEGGTITHVYPLQGNESVIGYNILTDSARNREALMTIQKRELYFAGPFKLKQGGVAIVGRLPLFINNKFWGFTVVLVKLNTLLKAAQLDSISDGPYIYQLSKVNPYTGKEEFFLPRPELFQNNPAAVSAEIPEGQWKIYVLPRGSETFVSPILAFSFLGFLLSALGGLFAWYIGKQPYELKKLVEEKTRLLSLSEESYRNILERVSDAFIALDLEWRFTYVNKKAGQMFNRDPAALMGKVIWNEFPQVPGRPFSKAFDKAMREQRYVYLEQFYEQFGFWLECHIYPSPNGITVFFRDVSVQKKISQELLHEKNLSDSIINSLPGVFYFYDRNGKFLRWNKNFEVVSGYYADEISKMHPLDFFDEPEKELLASRIAEVFEKGSSWVEAPFMTKYKEKIDYYFNGHMVTFEGEDYLIGMGIDITERLEAERQVMHEKMLSESIINSMPGIFYLSDINGGMLRWNKNFETITGYNAAEIRAMRVADFVDDDEKPLLMARKQVAINQGMTDIEAHILTKQKNKIPYWLSSMLTRYNDQPCLLGVGIDITARKKAEDQLKRSHEDIRRLNAYLQTVREEERAGIAREIHDELGQQLTGLKMDIAWLAKKVPSNDPAVIDKRAEMAKLIDNTVKTVRRISSDLRPGILDDLGLSAALEWQSAEFEKRTGIAFKFNSAINELTLDKKIATGIFRVFQEACTNIMRHSKATLVETSLQYWGNYVILTVKDNGVGFEAGRETESRTLGLLGMRERALMLGGELNIESQKNKGTEIVLRIPIPGVS